MLCDECAGLRPVVEWQNPPAAVVHAHAPSMNGSDMFPLLSISDLASMPPPNYFPRKNP